MKVENRALGYAWDQLYSALYSLATSNLSSRDRLLSAVTSHVFRILPASSTEMIPAGVSDRLAHLEEQLTKHGTFAESIAKMNDDQVEATIKELISLFSAVASAPSGKTAPRSKQK